MANGKKAFFKLAKTVQAENKKLCAGQAVSSLSQLNGETSPVSPVYKSEMGKEAGGIKMSKERATSSRAVQQG